MNSPKKIRILHVVHAFRAGGMENIIAEVTNLMPRDEFEIAVCALDSVDDFKDRLPEYVKIFSLQRSKGFSIKCILDLRGVFSIFSPDIVHSHNWNSLVYCYFSLIGTSIILLHGEHAQFYDWEMSWWRMFTRKVLYARASLVHTVSNELAKFLYESGLVTTVDLISIPNGVNCEKFMPVEKRPCRSMIGVHPESLVVGMFARCVPEKRHWIALKAFETLGAEFPNLTLIFAGSGGQSEMHVRNLIETHPHKHQIIWLGHRNDMPTIYNCLDVLVLPSKTEGMSNVCLEAMSSGVPVLVHAACGVAEVIQDGLDGCVCQLESAIDLINPLRMLLLGHDKRKLMGLRARQKIEQTFALSMAKQTYIDVYRRLLHLGKNKLS